jgi:hypothetical protein
VDTGGRAGLRLQRPLPGRVSGRSEVIELRTHQAENAATRSDGAAAR